jgi:ATP-dependent Clp endopeptidase proteolytic subunit ClpP
MGQTMDERGTPAEPAAREAEAPVARGRTRSNRPARPPRSAAASRATSAASRLEGDGDAFFATQLAVTLPLGPAPTDLCDQRTWAEIRRLQLDTDRAVVELDALRRRELDFAADAARAHVYTFYSAVDADSVRECMSELGLWSRRDPGSPITVVFNSPGGSVLDGLALFDYLRQLRQAGHHVTTVALGRAASMGAVLLQAGDRRLIGENAFMLVHEVSHLSAGKVSEMEDNVDFTRRLQKRLLTILASRSTLSDAQIARRWARKEWWLDASEAVELGFADATS